MGSLHLTSGRGCRRQLHYETLTFVVVARSHVTGLGAERGVEVERKLLGLAWVPHGSPMVPHGSPRENAAIRSSERNGVNTMGVLHLRHPALMGDGLPATAKQAPHAVKTTSALPRAKPSNYHVGNTHEEPGRAARTLSRTDIANKKHQPYAKRGARSPCTSPIQTCSLQRGRQPASRSSAWSCRCSSSTSCRSSAGPTGRARRQ